MTKKCSVDGCDRKYYCRGWCRLHYDRCHAKGEPGSAEVRPYGRKDCSIDGCEKPHFSIGLCNMHHQRWRKHGDPIVVIEPQRAEMVNNPAVHYRLRMDRGPARDHVCESCGKPANNWAYDHSDPNEIQDAQGPYSFDQSRYMPLCFSCHTRFDRRMKRAAVA